MLNSSKGEEGILVTRGMFSVYLNVKKVWLHFFPRGECSVLSTSQVKFILESFSDILRN